MSLLTLWPYSCALTIDHTKLASDRSNYTLYLCWSGSVSSSNLPSTIFDADGGKAAKSDGSDIRFTSDLDGTVQLAFEIRTFSTNNNPASALAEIWVKIPNVYSASNAVIYIWWGNSNAQAYADTDTYGKYNTWPSAFKAVWHLQETSANYNDSTTNNCVCDASSNVVVTTTANGKIGKAQSFKDTAGSIAYISMPSYAVMRFTSGMTIAAWINADTYADGNGRIIQMGTSDNAWRFWHNTSGLLNFECKGLTTNTSVTSVHAPSTGSWHRVLATFGSSVGGLRIYIDGAADNGATASGTITTTTDNANIGHKPSSSVSGDSFNGKIDELSLQNAEISPDWALADYNSQNSPQTYWSLGQILLTSNWFLLCNRNSLYNTMQLTNGLR